MPTTTNARAIEALRPGWLLVDNRTPRQLLAQTVPIASLFNFFDDRGSRQGGWNAFFENIPMVRYARFAETSVAQQARIFQALLRKLGVAFNPQDVSQVAAAWDLIDRLLTLYSRIDDDARFFSSTIQEATYATTLGHAISGALAQDYQVVLACARWLAKKHQPPFKIPFYTDTHDQFITPNVLLDEGWRQVPAADSITGAQAESKFVRQLASAAWATHAVIAQLVPDAQRNFAQSYADPVGLQPHFALYLAFIRQFEGAQQAINQIPQRHRDFYYRNVLRLVPGPAIPDTAFVAFTAAPGSWIELPQGTPLLAGKDASGAPVIYATTTSTTVTTSSVARLATVSLADQWSIGANGFYFAANAASADGAGAPLPPAASWATFGETQTTGLDRTPLAPAARTMADGQAGFAISSPVLHLTGGTRSITLEIAFTAPPGAPAGVRSDYLLTALSWNIEYSGLNGWVLVPNSQTSCTLHYLTDPAGGVEVLGMTVTVALTPGDPACVNFDPKTLDASFDPRTPVLRVRYLNPLAAFCGLDRSPGLASERVKKISDAFAAAPVATINVSVVVAGMRDLVLHGPSGKLSPGTPLAIFGSPPRADAVLAIGKVELFRKHLSTLTVTVDWQGLPTDPSLFPNGLSDYYEDYLPAVTNPPPSMFRNDQYLATLSALQGGAWQRIDLQKPPQSEAAYLFSWSNAAARVPPPPVGILASSRTWSAQPAGLAALTPNYALADPLEYSPSSTTGFLSLSLDAPDYLFGQQLFPIAVSTAALDNSLAVIEAARRAQDDPAVPPAGLRLPTAYMMLKVPAGPSLGEKAWSLVGHKSAPRYTFNPLLFKALPAKPVPPPDIAAALIAAKRSVGALPALSSLQDKIFVDLPSFRQLIAGNLQVDLSTKEGAAAVDAVAYWMATLVFPKPPTVSVGIKGLPRPPLVPTALNVTVDYSANALITVAPVTLGAPLPWDLLWQVSPLATYPALAAGAHPLIPSLTPGGCLFLGLTNVQPPETLSFLFTLEATAAPAIPDLAPDSPPVWSYLVGDSWVEIKDHSAVRDGTWGFLSSGIIRVNLPNGADTVHTVMPAGLVWLRIRVDSPARRLRTLQVLSHAAEVAWVPPVDATAEILAGHFVQPLPVGSITGPQTPSPAIQKTVQPLPGCGGAPPESDDEFANRVSERLKHKGRAVASPDYERLILQQFPAVFSAHAVQPDGAESAGTVTIVVLPTLKTPPLAPPPSFVPGHLAAIQSWLAQRAPLSAQIIVTNPRYDTIQVSVEVQFATDQSWVYYQSHLTTDLKAFISPWIYHQAQVKDPAVSFHASDFSSYIRSRPYVVQVGRCDVYNLQAPTVSLDVVAPSSPLALLISAGTHDIKTLP